MVSMLIFNRFAKELTMVEALVKDIAARLSEEKWELARFSSLETMQQYMETGPLMDLACYDVTVQDSIDYLAEVRQKYSDAMVMLIADTGMSPMDYVRPDILASALVLRPLDPELIRDKISDMVRAYLKKVGGEEQKDAFIIEVRDGKTRIPYDQIYYMEAREKKIYLRLQDREMSFYGTIEELEESLPEKFIRCHRSFLVNKDYVEKIMLSQNEILMSHGISVPLSRSYKPVFKALR